MVLLTMKQVIALRDMERKSLAGLLLLLAGATRGDARDQVMQQINAHCQQQG